MNRSVLVAMAFVFGLAAAAEAKDSPPAAEPAKTTVDAETGTPQLGAPEAAMKFAYKHAAARVAGG
jgi:hypothetical protein